MQLIHTADNFLQLQQLKQLLIENDIDCMSKGENSIGSGSAAGEIPPAVIKNTLHVFEDDDIEKAKICTQCQETVDKEFLQCWNCGADYQRII